MASTLSMRTDNSGRALLVSSHQQSDRRGGNDNATPRPNRYWPWRLNCVCRINTVQDSMMPTRYGDMPRVRSE